MRVFCILYVVSLIFSVNVAADTVEPRYDGEWWLTLTEDEKLAFYEGFDDCYVTDVKNGYSPDKTYALERNKITKYYLDNPGDQSEYIYKIIIKLENENPRNLHLMKERHQGYDGELWRMYIDSDHLAFVRGYIDCRVTYLHSTISKPIKYYVGSISSWYGIVLTDPGEINEKTGGDKIGDVLVRLLEDKAKVEDPSSPKKWWQKIFWRSDK